MINLEDIHEIKQLDTQDQLGSAALLGKQFEHGWKDVRALTIPNKYAHAKRVVFSGMGGSALGAYVAKALYGMQLSVPFEIINDYHLPAYVDNDTLVIVQSYSGSTEETLSCFHEAHEKGAMMYAITKGGELGRLAQENNVPCYIIDPQYNPCNQPRMAIGYSIAGLIAFLHSIGWVNVSDDEMADIQEVTKRIAERSSPLHTGEEREEENDAIDTAHDVHGRYPILISAEFLAGTARVIRNQFHENAKNYASEYPLPEMNHHLLESLSFPKDADNQDMYVFIESNLYSDRIMKRIHVSRDVIKDAGHSIRSIRAEGNTKLGQIFSVIQMGAYAGIYLALLNGIDPSPIPQVDKLKAALV